MAFFGRYLLAPSVALRFRASFFGNEGAKVVRMTCKFYLDLTVFLEFSYFKCFCTSRKFQFKLLLGGFLDITPRNMVKLV